MRIGALLVSLSCLISPVHAADISVVGDWTRFIDEFDLVSGAGSDLQSTIESDAAQATMDITNTGGGDWTVKVRKSDIDWPAGVDLAVSLSHAGSGTGTVSGGGYVTLNGTDQVFATGTADRIGMQIQLRLTGQSVSNSPPDSYNTSITYTLE